MDKKEYVDPFTSDQAIGKKQKEPELNVCVSCEG